MYRLFLTVFIFCQASWVQAQEGIVFSAQEMDELVAHAPVLPVQKIQVDVYVGPLDETDRELKVIATSYQSTLHAPVTKTDILQHLQAMEEFQRLVQEHPHIPLLLVVEAHRLDEEQGLKKTDVLTEFQLQRYGNFD